MKNTTNDKSLMQVMLARFGSFGIETTVCHGPLRSFLVTFHTKSVSVLNPPLPQQ